MWLHIALIAAAFVCSRQLGADAFQLPAKGPKTSKVVLPVHVCGQEDVLATNSRRVFLATSSLVGLTGLVLPQPALADDDDINNDFIQALKARSDANRDKYNQEARTGTKLDNNQFSGQYKRPKYVSVRRVDGTFKMIPPEALEDLLAKGIVIEDYDTVTNKVGVVKPDYRKGKIVQFPNAEAEAKLDKLASRAPAQKVTVPPPSSSETE
ncbi:expressed unknown protein [Seminavis robusta]|uniref:Uncharacterized protein n=1 Tax=Seminavis robusta TaxID=568900 RepID=A0A9N8H854_9STRA|nr:expressed unknown protein [Seminavis robusta]|eukprot:Sro149_g068540.1 n/a (210) ;mRNA; r:67397-68026